VALQIAFCTPHYSQAALQKGIGKASIVENDSKALSLSALTFDKTLFGSADRFYLGAAQPGEGSSSLVLSIVRDKSQGGGKEIQILSVAQENVFLNVVPPKDDEPAPVLKPNPFFDAQITQLAFMNTLPVLTFVKGNNNPDDNQRICLLESSLRVATNTMFLNDANSNQTNGIVGLCATRGIRKSRIFALVAPSQGTFGEAGSGLALLGKDTKASLFPVDAATGEKGNKAFSLDASLLQINGAPTIGSGPLALHWDSALQRLFIALPLSKSALSGSTGGVALLVGRLVTENLPGQESKTRIEIEPTVGLSAGNFTQNSNNHIVGFLHGIGNATATNLYHVRTMHTMTGNSYVIVNGGTSSGNVQNEVYALPIKQPSEEEPEDTGKIVKKTDFTELVASVGDMTLKTDEAALVGGGTLPIQSNQAVERLFVVGNAVFACVAGDRTAVNREAGIFQSAALFAPDGKIRSWTPWKRVMGSVDKVFGGGLDVLTGNFWYLTEDNLANKSTVKVTQWGSGEASPGLLGGDGGDVSKGLISVLKSEFPQAKRGVHQMCDFGPTTPGLSNEFSFLVATGASKVALIETGRGVNGALTPNTGDFATNKGQNIGSAANAGRVQPFTDAALTTLGPIVTADVSRIANGGNQGWLFVGGPGGVAVLSDNAGNGWDTNAGLSAGFNNISANFSFKTIGAFDRVRRVACDGQNLYVLTDKALYRASMAANKFSPNPVPLNAEIIATPQGLIGSASDSFLDFVVVGSKAILSSTNGLFAVTPSGSIATVQDMIATNDWEEVTTQDDRQLGAVSHLFVMHGVQGSGANVFVMASDLALDVAVIYHFDVQESGVLAVASPSDVDYFFTAGEVRNAFFSDGSLGFHTHPRHFDRADFLRVVSMGADPLMVRVSDREVLLENVENVQNAGIMIMSSASGARLFPLDNGIQVNE